MRLLRNRSYDLTFPVIVLVVASVCVIQCSHPKKSPGERMSDDVLWMEGELKDVHDAFLALKANPNNSKNLSKLGKEIDDLDSVHEDMDNITHPEPEH